MFLSTYELEHGRHVARLHRRRRRRRRAYAPTSNTASHDTHETINPWVSFCALIWVWGSTWRPSAAGAPLLFIQNISSFLKEFRHFALSFSAHLKYHNLVPRFSRSTV